MVVDDDEELAAGELAPDPPVSPPNVPNATIMAQPDGHLNKSPVELSLPDALFRVVSPVEPFDHTPLRGRDRQVRPPGYFRLRRTVCKMPPLLM